MSTTWQPTLTGLTLPQAASSNLSTAAQAQLAALDRAGLLGDQHALTVQLILDLCTALDRGLGSGKLSVATSQAVRQLLDALDALPKIESTGESDVLAEFQKMLAEA